MAATDFGIAVYGTDAKTPITDLIIDGNEVHHLKTGSSESLVVNGNVTNFRITHNIVHDNNNIGIDVIGFERTAPDPAVDQARDGVVSENLVYNITSRGNPAYGHDQSSDGIYVDGGTRVLIERNVIHDVDFGIELASEHKNRATSYITARNNLIYHCNTAGMSIGGYDPERGHTDHCTVVNNTLYDNDTDITWGQDIAITQFYPPHMYLFLFLVALPGQLLFGVTTMTMAAVLTTYLFGLCYYALTGTYYFFDSYIPIAVFLGMHLLFTDPSTAPRTDLGRMIFGVLYGISTIALYALLGMAGTADVLRQAPASSAAQPVGQIDRPGRAFRSAAPVRSDNDRTFTFRQPPQSGVRVELGDRIYHHERSTGRRRSPSRPVDSILAAGLRAGGWACVPLSCSATRDVLSGSVRLVVQRTRHSAGGPGDGSCGRGRVD